MATPSNKQIKIGTDVNFNHNDLINANIDASKNEITNGSNIKLSTGNTTLMDIFNDKQDKLVAGKNIIINSDGDFWTDFGNEHENNLKLLNSIPSFSSIKIIFKALCSNTSFDDNALFCRVDDEKYIGVQITSKPGIWDGEWSEGQTDIEENKKYWYCLFSDDAQTFIYYTIEDNNYRLDNLPELSEWTEQCSIEDNFFADKEFYIGYNPVSYNGYWKGNIYELQIKLDDAEWFNLKTAEEGVDYENNGCTYVGKIDNPIISAPNITYKSGDNIKVDDTNSINFIGHNYTVKFIPGGLEGDTVLFEDTIITDSTLIFKNGQLLRNGEQYDYFSKIPAYVVNSIDDLEENDNLPPTTRVIFSQPLQDDDKIILINGLSAKQFTGITGTTLDTGSNVNSNIIVLKNGILLCGENSWSNIDGNNIITFGTPLNENDLITIIPNYNIRLMYTSVSPSDLEDGDTLLIPRHMSNATLVWVNTLLLTLSEDYDIVDGNKIKFYNNIITDNSFVQVSLDNADSIYNAIGDKQDRLPDYEPGKVLGTDGNSLMWVDTSSEENIFQTDYWQHAEVIQDTITGITGDIIVNENIYLSQVTGDRWVSYFKYDGSDWYLGDPDEGETSILVNLNDYGIDVSQATFDIDSSFEVYSEYLNNKSSFTASQLVDIHSVFLNGILQLKKDYTINDHTITFNNYILKSSDSISII